MSKKQMLEGIRYCFSEAVIEADKPVLIAREADFIHRRGITMNDLKFIKENFDNNVVGLEIDFDYVHKEDPNTGSKAAGWIKSLEFGEVEVDGKKVAALFAVPEWTPPARQAIADREYKYTSPEIFWEWTHPESGKKYSSVLRSVAILNRPQIPGQPSIKLSEAMAEKTTKEDLSVKKLIKFLSDAFGAKFKAEEVGEDEIVSTLDAKFKADTESIKTRDSAFKELEVKFKALEATQSTDVKEVAKFKAEADIAKSKLKEFEDQKYADKVKALVENASKGPDFKMTPAEANGYFKEIAEKDIALAERMFAAMPARAVDKKPGPVNVIDASGSETDEKGISLMREQLAKERGIKFAEVPTRAAYDAYYAKKDGGK